MKTFHQTGPVDMRKLLILIVSTLIFQLSKAQDTVSLKPGTYEVLVHSGKRITAGYLNSISDTSVYVSPIPVAFNSYLADKSASGSISYNQIYKLKIRRKGNAGRGIIIGALAGAATGAMIGYASAGDGSWFKGSELAKTGGVVLGLTGALIGAIIGSAYKTFIVKNNKEKFDEFKRQLVQED